MTLSLHPIVGIGQIVPGDDLAGVIASALTENGPALVDGDIVVVCQKVVSKAEGRVVSLAEVTPGTKALEYARAHGKDPALIELALQEATEVLRMTAGHLITATGPGFVCANAGIDRSNQANSGEVTLLPLDADASAERLRAALGAAFGADVGIVVSDTFGRPWRLGQVDVALGAAGIPVLDDHAGRTDWTGRGLEHTLIAVGDQLAAAAGLVMGKSDGVPAVVVRGYSWGGIGGRAADLVRPREDDLFR